jgi:hypothetical protein
VLTRMRVVGLVIGLAAAGSLAAGLAAVWADQPAAPASAGLAAHSVTSSPSAPGRDNVDARPAASGPANPLRRATASKAQPGTGPAASQQPAAASASPSYYTIHNQAHGLCLNAMNDIDNAQVDVADCNGSWYQEWLGLKDGSAEEVVNKQSGLCLNAKSVGNGANVDIATCSGDHNELWVASAARLNLEDASSNLCLAGDSAATNESPAGAAVCTGGTSQQWTW